jgi:endonuclease-3
MNIPSMLSILRQRTSGFQVPLINQIIQEFGQDSYLILIACLLSLRARDTTTIHVCRALFTMARTPTAILSISLDKLETIIYKTGYYKTKAKVLQSVSQELLNRFAGKVPNSYETLVSIKGVGPKTANLVMGMGFGIPSICVDTHVHRISNRLGLIQTNNPEASELAMQKILPQENWIEYNKLLVMWGQNVCTPLSPRCSICPLREIGCKRINVRKSR